MPAKSFRGHGTLLQQATRVKKAAGDACGFCIFAATKAFTS